MESRQVASQLARVADRLPSLVHEELEAYIKRWESLGFDDRQFLEKCLQIFDAMLPHQIRDLFKEAEAAQGDEKRKKIKETLKKLAAGCEVPSPNIEPSVVVVIIGGNVTDSMIGFKDPKKSDIPCIWNEIRPFGCFVPVTKSMWGGKRTLWMGEFLTGMSLNGITPDGPVFKFKVPTVCDLFRKASGVAARDSWIVTRGDEHNIIYDYLEFDPQFEDRFKPTAITGAKLRAIDGYVQDHILSRRKEGKHPFEIQRTLPTTLTPEKLHLDVDFDNIEVRKFVRNVVAEHGGGITDSDAFILRLGVRLLQNPVMAPRLAIFHFGGIPGIAQMGNLREKKAIMANKMRDDDRACLNLWRAFRSNPYYMNFGTFVVVSEYTGAVFVGPKIQPGTASKPYYLNQFVATLGVLLGFEAKKFLAPSRGNPKDKPIKEIFRQD